MDSSRSGLFSTLLMTLPLIIVPAMALLRPPNPASSVSSQNLAADDSASDSEHGLSADELGFPDDFSGRPSTDSVSENSDDVDINAIFGNDAVKRSPESRGAPEDVRADSTTDAPPHAGTDPFQKTDSAPQATAPNPGSGPRSDLDNSSAQRLVQQLNALGSIRTLWFDAGDRTPVGFAAFFRGQTELTVYRFEAVGQTRAECAGNVLEQVTAWRRQTATSR
ncbi:MAG: hypothetical protein ACKO2P_17445 [Planctomycetota bacterium]